MLGRFRRLAAGAVATVTAFVAVACGLDAIGTRDLPTSSVDAEADESGPNLPSDGAPSVDAAVDASPDAKVCPDGPGPRMMMLGDSGACIDATEVTKEQYDAFLAATSNGTDAGFLDGGTLAMCQPFVTFAPKLPPPGGPTHPVTFVEWCDAYAYCRWAGKHLCTGPSPTGGPGALEGGEWLYACTAGGMRSLPYGDASVPGTCNVGAGGATEAPGGSFVGCQGGFDGIFDLVGNVAEWVDDCSGSLCRLRGGFYGDVDPTCTRVDSTGPRIGTSNGIGFRCCY